MELGKQLAKIQHREIAERSQRNQQPR
ncbi:hypothetical protein ACLK2I_22235 [Escherichia coli]